MILLKFYTIVNHFASLYTAAPVIDPPSSPVRVAIGMSNVTLSCTSRGSPPDTFTLIKDGLPVDPPPSVATVMHTDSVAVFSINYVIPSIRDSNVGMYTCTVTNPIGTDSSAITVEIGKWNMYHTTLYFSEQCLVLCTT